MINEKLSILKLHLTRTQIHRIKGKLPDLFKNLSQRLKTSEELRKEFLKEIKEKHERALEAALIETKRRHKELLLKKALKEKLKNSKNFKPQTVKKLIRYYNLEQIKLEKKLEMSEKDCNFYKSLISSLQKVIIALRERLQTECPKYYNNDKEDEGFCEEIVDQKTEELEKYYNENK